MENLEETQKTIETVVNKYRLVPFLRERAKLLPLPSSLEDSIEQAIAIDILAHMFFYKRTTPDVLIGLLYKRFSNVNLCLQVLNTLIEEDLLDYEGIQVITRFSLKKQDTEMINEMMYPPPLVIPPKKVMRNTDTGYHFSPRSSIVLRNSFYAGNTNLEHINRVNSIPLRLNTYVLEHREHTPKKELNSNKDRVNWNRYVSVQSDITDFYKDNTFYLIHKYDKRGRIYCQGYHISYQSDDFTNSLVEFANGEKVI